MAAKTKKFLQIDQDSLEVHHIYDAVWAKEENQKY